MNIQAETELILYTIHYSLYTICYIVCVLYCTEYSMSISYSNIPWLPEGLTDILPGPAQEWPCLLHYDMGKLIST